MRGAEGEVALVDRARAESGAGGALLDVASATPHQWLPYRAGCVSHLEARLLPSPKPGRLRLRLLGHGAGFGDGVPLPAKYVELVVRSYPGAAAGAVNNVGRRVLASGWLHQPPGVIVEALRAAWVMLRGDVHRSGAPCGL